MALKCLLKPTTNQQKTKTEPKNLKLQDNTGEWKGCYSLQGSKH